MNLLTLTISSFDFSSKKYMVKSNLIGKFGAPYRVTWRINNTLCKIGYFASLLVLQILHTSSVFAGGTGINFSKEIHNFQSNSYSCTKYSSNVEVIQLKGAWIARLLDGICIDNYCETHFISIKHGCLGGVLSSGAVYFSRRPGQPPSSPFNPEDKNRTYLHFETPTGAGGIMIEGETLLAY